MNDKMENAVRSVLKLDPEFDPVKADAAIQVLKGRSLSSMRAVDKFDHVVPRDEVAKLLRVDVHTVDALVRSGCLRRIPGRGKRALGISAISLKAYQDGKAVAELAKPAPGKGVRRDRKR